MIICVGEKDNPQGRVCCLDTVPWQPLVSRGGPGFTTPTRTPPCPARAPVCMTRATRLVSRTACARTTGSTRGQGPVIPETVGTTSISVEVGTVYLKGGGGIERWPKMFSVMCTFNLLRTMERKIIYPTIVFDNYNLSEKLDIRCSLLNDFILPVVIN